MSSALEAHLPRHTLVVMMEDKPGVLSQVVNLFRRRNYNIESLTVGHSETPDISRMTVVVCGDEGCALQEKHADAPVSRAMAAVADKLAALVEGGAVK